MATVPAVRSEAGLPIQEVSRRLGIPAPTLRAWDLRYGVPRSSRSPGGHRRYSAEDVERLRLMRDEIGRGRRARDAARTVHALLSQTGRARQLVEGILAAASAKEPGTVREALEFAATDLGLHAAVDQVLMPAMRRTLFWMSSRTDAERVSSFA